MGLASAERAGELIRPPRKKPSQHWADCSCDGTQGLLNIAGHPCVAYDPSGTVFAVALNLRSTIMMYDVKQFDKQPFLCVHSDDPVLPLRAFPPRTPVMTSLSFSNDGKWLLVGTSGDVHYVLDSFDGGVLARLESKKLSFRRRRPS
jgi:COMPASS component SWD2